MLELNLAEFKGKKALSAVMVSLLLIVITISAITIIYVFVKNSADTDIGEKVSCLDTLAISPSLEVRGACYINPDEIKVSIGRKSDGINLRGLKFVFDGEGSTRWLINGNEQCSDARFLEGEYGDYCDLVNQETSRNYVFNVSDLDRQKSVKLVVISLEDGKEISCFVGSKEVKESC